MRKELGVLLMEDGVTGEVAVQLFSESPDGAFHDLTGKPGDKPQRATLITLKYGENGIVKDIFSITKLLPIVIPLEDRADGFKLGTGPIKFDLPKE